MALDSIFVTFDRDPNGPFNRLVGKSERVGGIDHLYVVVSDIGHLSLIERWNLIREIKNEGLRYKAAHEVPQLTPTQRWYLVREIKDKELRYKAAYNVPELNPRQREELLSK